MDKRLGLFRDMSREGPMGKEAPLGALLDLVCRGSHSGCRRTSGAAESLSYSKSILKQLDNGRCDRSGPRERPYLRSTNQLLRGASITPDQFKRQEESRFGTTHFEVESELQETTGQAVWRAAELGTLISPRQGNGSRARRMLHMGRAGAIGAPYPRFP